VTSPPGRQPSLAGRHRSAARRRGAARCACTSSIAVAAGSVATAPMPPRDWSPHRSRGRGTPPARSARIGRPSAWSVARRGWRGAARPSLRSLRPENAPGGRSAAVRAGDGGGHRRGTTSTGRQSDAQRNDLPRRCVACRPRQRPAPQRMTPFRPGGLDGRPHRWTARCTSPEAAPASPSSATPPRRAMQWVR
jgi:hypothetical protein